MPDYNDLSEFQKWFFFYLIKYTTAPKSLEGVTKNMCLGVKMNIDVNKFEEEKIRLKSEATALANAGLLESPLKRQFEYQLSELGDLYLYQKILGPIVIAKQKKQMTKISNYFKNDLENLAMIQSFANEFKLDNPQQTFTQLNEKIIKNAMPWIHLLDKIHIIFKDIGGDWGLDPSMGGS